jgi:hypothetical protein
MRTTPLLVTLATLAAAALTSTAAPAGAAPTHSTTIAARTLQASRHAGPRPRNPDQVVENVGIVLPADP